MTKSFGSTQAIDKQICDHLPSNMIIRTRVLDNLSCVLLADNDVSSLHDSLNMYELVVTRQARSSHHLENSLFSTGDLCTRPRSHTHRKLVLESERGSSKLQDGQIQASCDTTAFVAHFAATGDVDPMEQLEPDFWAKIRVTRTEAWNNRAEAVRLVLDIRTQIEDLQAQLEYWSRAAVLADVAVQDMRRVQGIRQRRDREAERLRTVM